MNTQTGIDSLAYGSIIWHMVKENIYTQIKDLMWEIGSMISPMVKERKSTQINLLIKVITKGQFINRR
jgi:hypothetical protein